MKMHADQKALILKYQPYIYRDKRDPFPVRFIGCTVFTEKRRSDSFPKWIVDPAEAGAKMIMEYAIYYDYDIQHLYDLEHIWVAVGEDGNVVDCWCSFHGMRLRAAGVGSFYLEGTHPVLYSQPGKHAMLPDPTLFALHPQLHTACMRDAGGGLLIPSFLAGAVETNEKRDAAIGHYIRTNYSFVPSMVFEREEIAAAQYISWPALLDKIPQLLGAQLKIIEE
jgi:hypothetical protein